MPKTIVEELDDLISKGALHSRVERYLQKLREEKESFYAKTLRQKGFEAAEVELEKFAVNWHLDEFANSLIGIALGLRDLALTDEKESRVKRINIFPALDKFFGFDFRPTSVFVGFNQEQKGCGCSLVQGSEIWGLNGQLKLQGVILGSNGIEGQMVLIFSLKPPLNPIRDLAIAGYLAVRIENDGFVEGTEKEVHLRGESLWRYDFGLIQKTLQYPRFTADGGLLDDRFGFPGAGDYLAKHIGELGPYLSALAVKMKDHSH